MSRDRFGAILGGCVLLVALGADGPPGPAPVAKKVAKPAAKPAVPPKVLDPNGADVVTLRDGRRVLGQVVDGSPRGTLIVLVRRAWAQSNLPDRLEAWTRAEAKESAPANALRRDRLAGWKRERRPDGAGPDRIAAWLDRELANPGRAATPSPLLAVRLPRAEIKEIDRRGLAAARALRLGWTLGIADVETMPLGDLNDALTGRGLIAKGETPISLDALLPTPIEPDLVWLRRRAATEVLNDEGLRFVRYGGTILPEPGFGAINIAGAADAVLSDTIKDLLGTMTGDPLQGKLRDVAARGRVGALVTRLDMGPDMESVTVRASLTIRGPSGLWVEGLTQSGTVRSRDVAPGAVDAIADDPQVKSLFGAVELLGFGGLTPEAKRKGLAVGAMTRRAIGLARSAVLKDLSTLALPLDPTGGAGDAAKPPEPKGG